MGKLDQLYFNKFTRVNESVHAESLKEDELQTLINMRLDDELAAASTRKGFSRYNSNQVDTTGVINSVYDVEDANGNNYLLAGVGTKLRRSLNGTGAFSDIKTGLTAAKLRMAIYGENFFFTNGNEEPFYSDLTAANTFDLSLETPDITGVTVLNNSSNPNPTTYTHRRYLVIYVTDDGQLSNPSVYFETRFFENLEETGSIQYDLSGLPVPTDSRIVSKKIYRSKANELSNFYLLDTLEPDTTTYSDVTFDSSLLSETVIDYVTSVNSARYITTNTERVMLGYIDKQLSNQVIPPGYTDRASVTQVSAGNVADGTYVWSLSYVDQQGNESALTEVITETITSGPKTLTIRNVCMPITRTTTGGLTGTEFNESIKSVRLYRTKVGTTSPFFLVVEQDVADVIWNNLDWIIHDNVADASLGAEYTAVGNEVLKSAVIFSNAFSPLEFPELNTIQVYPDDNDPITGILDDDNGVLVFKERSICKIYTNGDPTNWQTAKLIDNVGCDEPNSIQKYGDAYFFYYENRPYIFDGRSVKNIGESLKDTFDSVAAVNGASFWHDGLFYVLAATVGTQDYLLAYDTKLDGWYKWTINQADEITTKVFGTDKGKILIGGNTYIIDYNESQDYDSDTGTRVDITATLKTKDYVIDGFINMRLMMFFIHYEKLLNRTVDNIVFMLQDVNQPTIVNTYNDNSSTVVNNKFKIPTDAMVGTLKRARAINFQFSGVSMDKFIGSRLDYLPEVWGVERRSVGDVSGLGVSHGSEAGVSD